MLGRVVLRAHGWTTPTVAACLTIGVLALAGCARWEARADDPLLPLGVLADRPRVGCCVAVAATVAALLALSLLVTYYLQQVLGYSPLQASLAFLPLSAAVFVSSQGVARFVAVRVPPGAVIVPGLGRVSVHDAYPRRPLPRCPAASRTHPPTQHPHAAALSRPSDDRLVRRR